MMKNTQPQVSQVCGAEVGNFYELCAEILLGSLLC